MVRLLEILEDDDKQLSCYRLCFIGGCIGLFGLATAQFVGIGSLPVALYAILATMASAGYVTGKYNDRMPQTIIPDATNGENDAS
jgi:hypothetical protein